MSEYTDVENPLLNQLASMGWQMVEQAFCISQNPVARLYTNFRERPYA